jgi:TPR repeat protein
MRGREKKRWAGSRRYAAAIATGLIAFSFVEDATVSAALSADRFVVSERTALVATPRLQAAARRGNTRAQTMLGLAYETGRGVPQNYLLALEWYGRAAARGNATAQYLLGLMYDKGLGVPADKVIAHQWLILAAARASNRQREYFIRIRNAVASSMSVDEIAQSQALAEEWTATHGR